jgi:hypothetical protein
VIGGVLAEEAPVGCGNDRRCAGREPPVGGGDDRCAGRGTLCRWW